MFVLKSDITIGKFRFNGVNEVGVFRSIHDLADRAIIKLPANASVVSKGKTSAESVTTATQFKEGDAVIIKLGYGSEMNTEFAGFVKQLKPTTLLEIICEGYSWLLRRNKPETGTGKTKIKDLLQAAVSGLPDGHKISVECDDVIDFEGLQTEAMSGFDIITLMQKATDNNLTCFFREPNVLWCGLLHTALKKGNSHRAVRMYRPGYNMPMDNSLSLRSGDGRAGKITYLKQKGKNQAPATVTAVINEHGVNEQITLNNIENQDSLRLLANEKALGYKYTGFEGKITSFLQPFAVPGDIARFRNDRNAEMNGDYLIESTEVRYGSGGARRVCEPGTKIAD
jgi:hypothetical protein